MIILNKSEVLELLNWKNSVASSMELPKIGRVVVVFEHEYQQKEFKHFFFLVSNDISFDGKDHYGNDVVGDVIKD